MNQNIEPANASETIMTIELEELRQRLAAGTIQEFWNVLTDKYFSGEFIPGSRRMPLDLIGRSVSQLGRDASIVVYCTNYDCPQSHMAATKLAALGFTHVLVYKGGLQEWEEAGYELVVQELDRGQLVASAATRNT